MSDQPPNLDAHLTQLQKIAEITRPIYETLLTIDANYDVQPMLAESYERSDDGLSYTFVLREGLKFHDGSDLDATDVVASMERWTRLTAPGQDDFGDATWAEIDPLTVELTVPTASFLHELQLAARLLNVPAIMPSEVIEAAGDDPVQEAIGSGPYRVEEWIADQTLTLTKWDDYQSVDAPSSGLAGAKNASIDELVFTFLDDATTAVAGLQTGQYDVVTGVGHHQVPQIEADDSIVPETYQYGLQNLAYNIHSGPASDVRLRQAMNMAYDRDEMMLAAVGDEKNYTLIHDNMAAPWQSVWNTDVGKAGFNAADTEGAKALLAESDYNGEALTLIVSSSSNNAQAAAVVLQDQMAAIGVNVSIEAMEWAAFIDRYLNDYDSWDLGIITQVVKNEPTQTIGWVSSNPGYQAGSPELAALEAAYRGAETLADAQALYDDMQQYIEDLRPLSRLGDTHDLFAYSTRLENLAVFDASITWWNVTAAP
ncbi:ABC transporter substrate-binding protein [Leucobacter albus]|uniref:ABC transporter substrate-binding protein n=1 Tax=Leucobacter albus TaxID=272210 RepID=A0ABW3TPN8_9MICO